MLYKAREKFKKYLFNVQCNGILDTPPMKITEGQLIIVSMVSHFDFIMYIIAAKSLYFRLGVGQFVVLNDGTLTKMDIDLIKEHLSPIEIVSIKDIKCGKCPRGGTWERILLISEYAKDNYVIQVDSDTIAIKNIPEVLSALNENRSFALGTKMGQKIITMNEICENMKKYDDTHIQVISEKNFDRLRNYNNLKYLRGCSGFAGFGKGSFLRPMLEDFSEEMENIVGKSWWNWGSEQVASNFIIANSPSSCVLPYPKYANLSFEIPYEDSSFLHFIGTIRFDKGIYKKKANEIVQVLNK